LRSRPNLLGYAFVAPTLLFLLALNVFPLVYNVGLSFTNAQLGGATREWVGTDQYKTVFDGLDYGGALRTTGLLVLLAVGIELVLGYVLALAIHKPFPGKTVVLTILLVPMMLSPAVMGLFWSHILNEQTGVLNQLFAAVGLTGPAWQDSPAWRFWSIVLIDVWMWTPFMLLISLAALGSIPPYIYEAAEIDRASAWTVFRRITLPMSAPLLGLAVLLRLTDALKMFDVIMAVVGPSEQGTRTLSVQLYQRMMKDFRIGEGSAYAIVVLVMVIALATLFTRYLARLQRR
jgi:multiple sugar transport system permease protein